MCPRWRQCSRSHCPLQRRPAQRHIAGARGHRPGHRQRLSSSACLVCQCVVAVVLTAHGGRGVGEARCRSVRQNGGQRSATAHILPRGPPGFAIVVSAGAVNEKPWPIPPIYRPSVSAACLPWASHPSSSDSANRCRRSPLCPGLPMCRCSVARSLPLSGSEWRRPNAPNPRFLRWSSSLPLSHWSRCLAAILLLPTAVLVKLKLAGRRSA